MNRTSPASLIVLAVIGAAAAYVLQTLMVGMGGARYEPQLSLPLALIIVAALIVVLAVPVWRASRGRSRQRIDPFHATRVVLLAKASALAGGLLTGAGIGLVVFLWFGPSLVAASSVLAALAAAGGSAVLLAAGLIAEHLCTVPPDDPDDRDRRDGDGPGAIAG